MTTQKALANVIYLCILGMSVLATISYYKVSNDPGLIKQVIQALGGIVLLVTGAKAGMALPSADTTESKTGTTDVVAYSSTKEAETK